MKRRSSSLRSGTWDSFHALFSWFFFPVREPNVGYIFLFFFFLDIGLHNSSLSVANMALLSRQVLGSVYGNDLGSQPILDVSVNRDNAQLGMVVS